MPPQTILDSYHSYHNNNNNYHYNTARSLLVLNKILVVVVVPRVILFEPIKVPLRIEGVRLLVGKHQPTLCTCGSLPDLSKT